MNFCLAIVTPVTNFRPLDKCTREGMIAIEHLSVCDFSSNFAIPSRNASADMHLVLIDKTGIHKVYRGQVNAPPTVADEAQVSGNVIFVKLAGRSSEDYVGKIDQQIVCLIPRDGKVEDERPFARIVMAGESKGSIARNRDWKIGALANVVNAAQDSHEITESVEIGTGERDGIDWRRFVGSLAHQLKMYFRI